MKFKLKDPGSAITHGIALLLAAVGAVPLIIKAARSYDVLHIVALSIFILTMVLLYAASTIYHSVDSTEKVNRRLRKMAFVPIFHALPRAGFDWLLAGGIIYTIGGVIYALKVPLFNSRHKNFGSHEIFHIFVMLGSACHFIVMYFFVAPLPV